MESVFSFTHYKEFISAWIEAAPAGGHGLRKKLAAAAQCKTAYISQVLGGKAHFSLEQAERVASLLELSADEKRFFFLLLQQNRAGTPELAEFFSNEMKRMVLARAKLKNRLKATQTLSADDHALYFDSWTISAVHAATTIKACRTKDDIARASGISASQVARALEFLVSRGILAETKEGYRSGSVHIHLPDTSPYLARHHFNWRLRAMQDIEDRKVEGLHYSAVLAFAAKDAPHVKAAIADALAKVRKLIEPSPEEQLFSISADFFPLGRAARKEDR